MLEELAELDGEVIDFGFLLDENVVSLDLAQDLGHEDVVEHLLQLESDLADWVGDVAREEVDVGVDEEEVGANHEHEHCDECPHESKEVQYV